MLGETLRERFVLKSVLGEGPLGTVYRALDKYQENAGVEDPYIAVKVVPETVANQDNIWKPLCRVSIEGRRLNHQNIMNFYEFDQDGDTAYLTLPLIDGQPLILYLEQHDIKSAETLRIIEHVGRALQYAHDHSMIHGDLSPATVFYTATGEAKVFDFGVRTALSHLAEPTRSLYASRSVLAGERPAKGDDLFSFAVMSYELLTGRHPFNENPADEALADGVVPEPVDQLSPKAWRALQEALRLTRSSGSCGQLAAMLLEV